MSIDPVIRDDLPDWAGVCSYEPSAQNSGAKGAPFMVCACVQNTNNCKNLQRASYGSASHGIFQGYLMPREANPIAFKEFHGLIKREARFRELGIEVATLECHDRYRCRVMEGKEIRPSYWFADKLPDDHPQDPYRDGIWWPHLVDRAAAFEFEPPPPRRGPH